MLKMAANCFSAAVCFSKSYRMGMDGDGFWRDSVSYSDVCITASYEDRLGNLFCTGKSFIMSETYYNDVLDIYDVGHR